MSLPRSDLALAPAPDPRHEPPSMRGAWGWRGRRHRVIVVWVIHLRGITLLRMTQPVLYLSHSSVASLGSPE